MKHGDMTRFVGAILIGAVVLFTFTSVTGEHHAAAGKPKTHVVAIRDSQFSPTSLTVSAGDTLIFRNDDIVPHTATGRAFDSGNLNKGQSWKYVAKAKGSFSYICTYHPSMKGRVVVR